MEQLPAALYRARELGEIDRRAGDRGLPAGVLMERAGRAAFRAIAAHFRRPPRWLVYAGSGNNGGDGYVVARLARRAGFEVTLAALKPPHEGGAAAEAAAAWHAAGGASVAPERADPAGADVIVDALFGTGLDRPPEGAAAEAIRAINAAAAPAAAIDLPSGLSADTGAAPGEAVRAALTVTFIGLKFGLFTGAGPGLAGRLAFARLGVPAEAETGLEPRALRIEPALAARLLAPRGRAAHKGWFGHVLVVGGDHGTGGAVRLAGEAALRSGAGLVSVATRPEHVPALLAGRPELMVHAAPDGALPAELIERANVIALGPGLGRRDWGRALWESALASGLPLVIDADGLNLLAGAPRRGGRWVLTPHPGEAARLLGSSVADVERDRAAAAEAIAERFDAVTVLKGAGTLVAAPGDEPLALCDRGNPGMASGGMGDALTGIVAGLLAQGIEPAPAARLGVWVHAAAGDRAARAGERGLLARDLVAEIRSIVNP